MSGAKNKNFKIEAFKNRVVVDERYADKTWKIIEHAIDKIYNHNTSELSFEELYRNAYNMVLHKFGEKLYSGLVSTLTSHMKSIAILIDAVHGDMFLEELNKKWAEHNKALQIIREILMFMDRTFLPSAHKTTVFELGLNLWRDNVIYSDKIKTRLQITLVDIVQLERTGDIINRGLTRNITKMFIDLGHTVYQDVFEKPFLDISSDFYRSESQQLIEHCDCGDYLKKAEIRLIEELDRVTNYLDTRTEPKIISVVEKEMIESHMQRLVHMEKSGLVNMMANEDFDDLKRMYYFLSRVSNGLALIRDVMTLNIKETGKNLVMDPEKFKDPVNLVQELLNMKDRLDKMIISSFNNDNTFQNALNSSFEYFISLNARSPEFISLFVDDILRNGLKRDKEEDIETVLEKVMVLFRYLQEKDIFEKYYKQHLAKRLLSGKTTSDDAERSLIVNLKTNCGYQFTSKIEGMFTDVKTSQDTMKGFHDAMGANMADWPALSVQVLTTDFWPTQSTSTCKLPSDILEICDKFKTHYLGMHTGRRLTWQTNMGSAVLVVNFGNVQKELAVSTYHMCILMLFNNSDRLSYKEIEQATEIPSVDLKMSLQSLACVKEQNVLRKEPMSREIGEDDVFYFNDKFTSKLYRVKIGNIVARESESETRQRVEEDRKPQIEAAIVRIMKARKVLDHNSLMTEVTKQLQSRFLPNPVDIKKRIERLIERDFLERDTVDRQMYHYIS